MVFTIRNTIAKSHRAALITALVANSSFKGVLLRGLKKRQHPLSDPETAFFLSFLNVGGFSFLLLQSPLDRGLPRPQGDPDFSVN